MVLNPKSWLIALCAPLPSSDVLAEPSANQISQSQAVGRSPSEHAAGGAVIH